MEPWERIVEPAVPLQLHAGMRYNGRIVSTGGVSNGTPVSWFIATDNAYRYERVENPEGFPARFSHAACVFDGRMWVSGGVVAGAIERNVIVSQDGKSWEVIHNEAPDGYYGHRMLAFGDQKEALVILGGFNATNAMNEVIRTSNGRNWEDIDVFGDMWANRAYFGALVYKGKLWVFGGINEHNVSFNDVWWTDDLRHWHLGNANCPWLARSAFAYCEFDERMWIIGGKVYASGRQNYNYLSDVWFSRDGTVWEQSFDFPTSLAHTHADECNRKLHVFEGLLGGSGVNTGIYRQNIG
jgi:hypothetical protein